MARASTVKRLPKEVQEEIGRLRDGGWTIDQILDRLRALHGEGRIDQEVSRSALGRHVQTIDAIGERIRKQRAVAEALVARFGEAPENRTARLNIELAHGILMDLMSGEDGEAVTLKPKDAAFLASAVRNLIGAEKSAGDVVKLRSEMVRQLEAEKAKAAEAVASQGRQMGMDDEAVGFIRAKILGITLPAGGAHG